MNEPMLKKKKKYTNKVISGIFSLCLMIIVVGISYAFFIYNKTGLYTHTINGGKMVVSYNETTGNNIVIANAYPLSDEEALTRGIEFEFTITGYNESEKNVYYAIEMDHGADVAGKDRFLDSDMKLSLYENDEVVFENEIFNNLDNQSIHYGIIDAGTSQNSPTVNNYKLRIWINNYVYISNTIENDTALWDDSDWDWFNDKDDIPYGLWEQIWYGDVQYLSDIGVSVYTSEEFANHYTNFKVNVIANLTAEDLGYVYYDAGGGEYEPKATSVLTNKITMQKPVMENKGFLGWSTDPNDNTVEYYSGGHYSGAGMALYAVYSDTRNVMGQIPTTLAYTHCFECTGGGDIEASSSYDFDKVQALPLSEFLGSEEANVSGITEIQFLNDTRANIDARYNAATVKADLTYNNQGSVKAWLEEGETGEITVIDADYNYETVEAQTYKLYIAAEGTIYLSDGVGLFSGFMNAKTIDFTYVDTSMVTDMTSMFGYYWDEESGDEDFGCYSLTNLNLSSFNTSQVTNMSGMFDSAGLESLDVSNFDTSNVTDMSNMFYYCRSLTSLDLSNFDTSQVTDMSYMFSDVSMTSLDLSDWDTRSVTNMSTMFRGCSNLTSLDVSNFDTSNVTDISWMFLGCDSLTSLDLSNWDTSNVTDMSQMFYGCSSLTTIYANSDWNAGKVASSGSMFGDCTKLVGAISYDASKIDVTCANPDTGYFTRKTV